MLPKTKLAFVDIESHGLDARWNNQTTIYCVCLIVVSPKLPQPKVLRYRDINKAITKIEELLAHEYTLVAHNAKYDYGVLKTYGLKHYITPSSLSVACTQVMEYHRDSKPVGGLSLDALTGMKSDVVQAFVDAGLLDKTISTEAFWDLDWSNNRKALKLIEDYCVQDLKATHKLYKRQVSWYNQPDNHKFAKALIDIEFPMLEVLGALERNGMNIDQERLSNLHTKLSSELDALQTQLNQRYYGLPKLQWVDDTYQPVVKEYKNGYNKNKRNIAHYLDDQGVLACTDPYIVYDHCQLLPYNAAAATGHTWWLLNRECPEVFERAYTTKKGKLKLDKHFLTKVADDIPEHLPLSAIGKLTKSLSMVETIQKHVREDGRIHCSFNNCQVKTGRLSTSMPNLQNFPRPDKKPESIGSQFRQLASATDDKVMMVADLDRIELVVTGWYLSVVCGDKSWQELCNSDDPGIDPHQMNADRWNMTRDAAKKTVFSLLYGCTGKKIMDDGNAKTVEEGEGVIASIYAAQPALLKIKQKVWAKLKKTGFITNIFGCHVPYPEINSRQDWKRQRAERESFNCQIQRTARDIMHMLVIESLPIIEIFGAKLVNIVHDECVVECPVHHAESLKRALNKKWQQRWDILKGSKVNGDWNIGATWYEAK